ncbi:MAG: divalent-cation tolerance protein CutA [Magnetospirillum sp.]|nr:divalent-cation tolerance protein CutA [Magnetospirillum sp.]
MDNPHFVYITAATVGEGTAIARAVVEARLAACANVLPGVTSVYWWDGAVQEGSEVAVILKTRADLVADLTAKIKDLHSYSCPCVVALPITGGNPAFLDWIAAETR